MTGAAVSLMVFAALLVTGLALEGAARCRPAGAVVATVEQALTAAMRTTPGRAAVLSTWVWIGVHFLAR